VILRAIKSFPWINTGLFALGGLLFAVAAPVVIESWAWLNAWYDRAHPPATAKLASHEYIDATTLRLRFVVTRSARECEFVRLNGFSGPDLTQMQPATTLRREDGIDASSYPSQSTTRSSPWVMSPVYGPRLLIVGHYDCSGRLVRTRLIDEMLP
jgi:hypothetical protein